MYTTTSPKGIRLKPNKIKKPTTVAAIQADPLLKLVD
jgi:hypothetical protein